MTPIEEHHERLLIVATGSIHVALLPAYLQLMQQRVKAVLRVVMTAEAASFLPARTVADFANVEVYSELHDRLPEGHAVHVGLPLWADRLLVLPGTANAIAKAANGITDDTASLCIQGFCGPRHIAPAMSQTLWNSPATKRNVATLTDDGWTIVGPQTCEAVGTRSPGEGVSPTPRLVLDHLTTAMSQISTVASKTASAMPT